MISERELGMGDGIPVAPLSVPFEEVARVFDGFSGKRPGGTVLSVNPRLHSSSPSYHVESSFSPEQQPFVNAVTVGLSRIITGHEVMPDGAFVKPLHTRLVQEFLDSKRTNYAGILTGQVCKKIEEFDSLHPNLAPALRAVFLQAGREGTELAISISSVHLISVSGEMDEWNPISTLAKKYVKADFTNQHPRTAPNGQHEYEVWCSGRNVAEAIMRESKLASEVLGEMSGVLDSYRPSEASFPPYINEGIRGKINKVLARIDERHGIE